MFDVFTKQPEKTKYELEMMTVRYQAQREVVNMLWDRIEAYRQALTKMRDNGVISEEQYHSFYEDASKEYSKLRSE